MTELKIEPSMPSLITNDNTTNNEPSDLSSTTNPPIQATDYYRRGEILHTTHKDLLLNLDLIYLHKKDFLIYIYHLLGADVFIDMRKSYYRYSNILSLSALQISKQLRCGEKTVRTYRKQYADQYEYCGSIAVLPRQALERLIEKISDLPGAEQNGLVRTFCYFICNAWIYRDFSRSQALIAQDLDNRLVDVRRRIAWLVNNEFIFIKHHQMHFAGKQSRASVYQLYEDQVPPHYVGTEWWISHLSPRNKVDLDEILQEYSNQIIDK